MEDARSEEKSPLLLYPTEDDGNVSKNNNRVNFDKGRLYGISSGATAVFTDFPNHISPCWTITLLVSLIFFVMAILIFSSMVPSSSIRVPRCSYSNVEPLGNRTIHLVHPSGNWNKEQLSALERIKREYEGFDMHLVLTNIPLSNLNQTLQPQNYLDMGRRPVSTSPRSQTPEIKRAKQVSKENGKNVLVRKKRHHMNQMSSIGNSFGVKSLLDMFLGNKVNIDKRSSNETSELPGLLNPTERITFSTLSPRPKTLDDVLRDIPGLTIRNVTPQEIFSKSPLHNSWSKFTPELLIFAARILGLWKYGGLSFKIDGGNTGREEDDLKKFSVASGNTLQAMESSPSGPTLPPHEDKLTDFILKGRKSFEGLPNEVVTADDKGLHIFTKSPCHVFFGEILVNLKRSKGDETPKRIIQKSLKVFCRHAAVGNDYCRHLIRRSA
ncbi:uncharacterized protein [Euwallacea similis]|uniref:uncharacterized protein n=1 Tax=Euwallacea similis TaxID=1736056 RepID=UPI00344BDAC6